jgi:hypothetical protein
MHLSGRWWLTPVILATQEAEIRRIAVQSQPGQIDLKTLSQKHPEQKGLVEWLKCQSACLASVRPCTPVPPKQNKKKCIWPLPQVPSTELPMPWKILGDGSYLEGSSK